MGADVEVNCREGADEHVVHLPGRPGSTLSQHTPQTLCNALVLLTHKQRTKWVKLVLHQFLNVGSLSSLEKSSPPKSTLKLTCVCVCAGHLQCGDQAEPLPGPPAALLLECTAVGPHPLGEVLQRRVGPQGGPHLLSSSSANHTASISVTSSSDALIQCGIVPHFSGDSSRDRSHQG